jgi:hypothetical protein
MSEVKTKKNDRDLELELLKAEMELLKGKVTKPKNSEEEFLERVARYEANKEAREIMQKEIEQRRMELQQQLQKARYSEIVTLEAWDRRAKDVEKANPGYATRLRNEYKMKVREINLRRD